MDTKILTVSPVFPEKAVIHAAAEVILDGGLVAFPTETVYGLGGDALSASSSEKIYAAKGRPSDNPLIVHIAEREALRRIAKNIPENAVRLMDACWPGPLTVILEKTKEVPFETTGGLPTVAIRMPSHPVAAALIRAAGGYIAAPSANLSGRPSPTSAAHVIEDLTGRIEMILDGGDVAIGLESTIVDFTEAVPTVLRPGYINLAMLEDVLGKVRIDPGILSENDHVRPKAPGMRYRHYAPKAPLYVVEGSEAAVTKRIAREVSKARAKGLRCAVLCSAETAAGYHAEIVSSVGHRAAEEEIAANLFRALRQFDEKKAEVIFSESFDTPRLGEAIMNRLLKAAGHVVIKAEEEDE